MFSRYRRYLLKIVLLTLITALSSILFFGTPSALASIDDDKYDGNIFALYAGNGSLVPPRVSLAESIKSNKPALLAFYIDDSKDCKQFSIVISQLQAYYGRAASFIPVDVDAIPVKSSYTPDEPGYYYEGVVPQTVVIDQEGKVAFNGKGQVSFESIDDSLREVFDLLPRTESVELKRRSFNEFNTELSQ
ncbi:MAG: thylakoid membrane photosystem I accumulation factor [Cyanobacteriota bacterium]